MTPNASRRTLAVGRLGHGGIPIPLATTIGDLLFTSALVGADPETGTLPPTLDEQVAGVFRNLALVLEEGGASPGDVGKVTVFMNPGADRTALNDEWVKMFPDPADRPVRHVVSTALHPSVLIQCEAIAVKAAATSGRTDERQTP